MSDINSFSYWDKPTIVSRIADLKSRMRYEAGSPNPKEVELYHKCILTGLSSNAGPKKRILVLGMTPEIRSMAVSNGFEVISVDRSLDAVEMYKDWIPDELKANEEIIQACWFELEKYLAEPVDAVLGDGVFGNILSVEKHVVLLKILKNILNDKGTLVFRKALVPDNFDPDAYDADLLIQKYRSGLLTDAEFGFSMRLWGNYVKAYNPKSFILDNSLTFQRYQSWMNEGRLSEPEYTCICHYYFNGMNMILPQRKWEEILISINCKFERHQLEGKDWYYYYPVYQCRF
ncbi:MAG: class I SAM-dependent methyltransferase [Bacteroidales bacterium]|nr:class I SAM-dependent methyltransferase [Bacteroidales bacterium]